jgi:alkylation response protein AidB-like acyl-CoA dehydrogenase
MIDFTLTEEQLLLQKTARDFAEKEIKPAVQQVEALDGSEFDPSDICRNVFRKGTKLGFHSLLIPEKYGGMGGSCLDHAILLEELGAADVGIAAAYFNSTICSPMLLVLGGNEAQREKWLPRICSGDAHVFCAGLSESSTPGSEIFCPYPDPSRICPERQQIRLHHQCRSRRFRIHHGQNRHIETRDREFITVLPADGYCGNQ